MLEPHEESSTEAREQFRRALLQTSLAPSFVGEVEAAAAHFCRALRREGKSPENMLVDAKQVIEQTIDGQNMLVAERAVSSCIQHYYRA